MTDYIALARECAAHIVRFENEDYVTFNPASLAAFAARIRAENRVPAVMNPLEVDALPGAALDPAIARLRGEIAQAFKDTVMMPIQTAQSIVSIMERARDALLAQDAPAARIAQASPEDAQRLALERITHSYRLLLSGKPVRDAAETLAEVDAALSAAPSQDREDATDTALLNWLEQWSDGFANIDRITSVNRKFNNLPTLRGAILAAQQAPKEPK